MPPADTYNAVVSIAELRASAARFKDHDRTAASLLVFGHGDGGGGPTAEMLEMARRAGDLQGVPRVQLAPTSEFFDRLEEDLGHPRPIQGELYFEYHRGTYTSQARDEARQPGGRAAAARGRGRGGARAPARPGGVPGGGAARAVADAAAEPVPRHPPGQLDPRGLRGRRARPRARRRARDGAARRGDRRARRGRVRAAEPDAVRARGARRRAADRARARLRLRRARRALGDTVRRDGLTLANRHLAATFDEQGRLTSLVHDGREALAGPANVLELSDDRPVAYDAWEIEPYTDDTRRALPGAHAHRVLRETPGARRARVRAPDRRAQHAAPDRAARRGLAPARVPRPDRLARAPRAAAGRLPARRAQPARHLRDAVRRRRAPDARQHPGRRRPVRGARAPLRRPLRARLRRRAAHAGHARDVLPRLDAADLAAARPDRPRSGGRPGRARDPLRDPAAPRELAGGGRGRRRRARSPSRCCTAPPGRARSRASTTRRSCSTRSSARRTPTA